MTIRSKATNEYEAKHALSEAIGLVGLSIYLGILAGVITQLAIAAGVIG